MAAFNATSQRAAMAAEQRQRARSYGQHGSIVANRQENHPELGTPQRQTSRRCPIRTTWSKSNPSNTT
jgi:hypothetical protein